LFHQRLHDGVVLSHLGLQIFLSLEERGDVALKLDEFAGNGLRGTRTNGAASNHACNGGGTEDGDITETHGGTSWDCYCTDFLKNCKKLLPGWGRRVRYRFNFNGSGAPGQVS
jgi:hypothetical protein